MIIDFSQPNEFSDVVLVVEDKKLHVNRIVSFWLFLTFYFQFMAVHSVVFRGMLKACGEYKEGHETEVPLDNKKYDEILELLKLLYPTNSNVTG